MKKSSGIKLISLLNRSLFVTFHHSSEASNVAESKAKAKGKGGKKDRDRFKQGGIFDDTLETPEVAEEPVVIPEPVVEEEEIEPAELEPEEEQTIGNLI